MLLEHWLRYRRLSLMEELDRIERRFYRVDLKLLSVNAQLRHVKGRRKVVPFVHR